MRKAALRRSPVLSAAPLLLLAFATDAAPADTRAAAPAPRRPRGVPVQVVNDANAAVPVVSTAPSEVHVLSLPAVQTPSKVPFQRAFYIEVPAGTLFASTEFGVPAGKRLVLEWVGGSSRVSGWENVRLTVSTTAGGVDADHDVATNGYRREFEGSSPPLNADFMVRFGQMVKLYADPGSFVQIAASRSEILEVTPTGFAVSVSGYLVDCGDDPACPLP